MSIKISYDETKRAATLAERGLDFIDAAIVFAGVTLDLVDDRKDYGETRVRTVGMLADELVMIVWTPRGQTRRVISMRKCNDKEKAAYQKRLEAG